MKVKHAWMRISEQILLELLNLPSGTHIWDAMSDDSYYPNDILFLVENEDLKEVEQFQEPEVTAHYYRQEPIVFEGWKYKE